MYVFAFNAFNNIHYGQTEVLSIYSVLSELDHLYLYISSPPVCFLSYGEVHDSLVYGGGKAHPPRTREQICAIIFFMMNSLFIGNILDLIYCRSLA